MNVEVLLQNPFPCNLLDLQRVDSPLIVLLRSYDVLNLSVGFVPCFLPNPVFPVCSQIKHSQMLPIECPTLVTDSKVWQPKVIRTELKRLLVFVSNSQI